MRCMWLTFWFNILKAHKMLSLMHGEYTHKNDFDAAGAFPS